MQNKSRRGRTSIYMAINNTVLWSATRCIYIYIQDRRMDIRFQRNVGNFYQTIKRHTPGDSPTVFLFLLRNEGLNVIITVRFSRKSVDISKSTAVQTNTVRHNSGEEWPFETQLRLVLDGRLSPRRSGNWASLHIASTLMNGSSALTIIKPRILLIQCASTRAYEFICG